MASFTFGAFRLDTATGTLWRGSETIELSGKLWDVLLLLVQRPGELLTPEAMAAAAWPRAEASPETVARTVRRLRLALGDPPEQPLYIESVYGRGFRFIAPVSFCAGDAAPSSNFVGRVQELATLHRAAAQTRHSGARVMLVLGDGGIGKSALLHRFLDDLATDAGIRVGHTACLEAMGSPEPFGPLLAIFEQWLAGDDGTVARLIIERAPSWARELRLLPDLPLGTEDGSLERMPREGMALLGALARDRPLVLVIDECGLLDAATLGMLEAVTRRRGELALLVVCAARRTDASLPSAPLHSLYAASADPARVERIDLSPLDEEALGHLLQKHAEAADPARLLSALLDLSGGHPLLALCLIEDWTARGVLDDVASGRLVPDISTAVGSTRAGAIAALLERRLQMLDAPSRLAIEAAALAGTQFDAREVAAALGDPEAEDRLFELARHEFLIEPCGRSEWPDGSAGHAYRFRHALLRTPLLERILPGTRTKWLRAIVERLETGYGEESAPVLGRLLSHSHELRDPARIMKYEVAAATSAVRRLSHVVAADHLLRAQAAADRLPESPSMTVTRGRLSLQAAVAIFHGVGAGDPRIEALVERARQSARETGATRLEYLSHLVRTGYHMRACRTSEAMEGCDRMVELASAHDAGLLPAALLYRGLANAITGRLPAAHEDLTRSLTIPRDANVPAGLCFERMARMYDALVLTAQGYAAAAEDAFGAAQRAAEQHGNAFDEVDLAYFRGLAAVRTQRPREAQQAAARVFALDAEHGFARHTPGATMIRDWARASANASATAAARMRDLQAQRRDAGELWDDTFCSYLVADVLLRGGSSQEAAKVNEAAREMAMRSGETFFLSELWRQSARISLARGGATSTRDARTALRHAIGVAREQDAAYSEWTAADVLSRCGPLSSEDERSVAAANERIQARSTHRPGSGQMPRAEISGVG
ncbi:MAG TPA: AAA family ATPase [Candidatus Binatia bacterium]|nr:AAA family ATPase [Candidatus Binatia bacterium]